MRRPVCEYLTTACLSVLVSSCMHCNRDGCDALGDPAGQGGTGIAGIVAQASDVIENGCGECGFGDATLRLWRTEAPLDEVNGNTLAKERDADVTIDASERYAQSLSAGNYLLCNNTCINLTVVEGQRLTVNVKLRYGPTSFFVGSDDAAGDFEEDFGFDLMP